MDVLRTKAKKKKQFIQIGIKMCLCLLHTPAVGLCQRAELINSTQSLSSSVVVFMQHSHSLGEEVRNIYVFVVVFFSTGL